MKKFIASCALISITIRLPIQDRLKKHGENAYGSPCARAVTSKKSLPCVYKP
ncbi:hypothetical protein WN55_10210 [Dufourea novaeangliae]|uniref:Uncharacterized protein n=1 Tax=Dufourea novaeangliae TaxID=178035 RepID=A0A154P360_DUFNO|nr:hypothetical protein WN55_10210 [Dufourea novaeangliae]